MYEKSLEISQRKLKFNQELIILTDKNHDNIWSTQSSYSNEFWSFSFVFGSNLSDIDTQFAEIADWSQLHPIRVKYGYILSWGYFGAGRRFGHLSDDNADKTGLFVSANRQPNSTEEKLTGNTKRKAACHVVPESFQRKIRKSMPDRPGRTGIGQANALLLWLLQVKWASE